MAKFWITSWALTKGIVKRDDLDISTFEDGSAYAVQRGWGPRVFARIGHDAHQTEQQAIARAEEMRIAKIASLEKQIAKLKKLKF